ncbi:MAG: RHS repeat-associated core domain-containing protein, partial [Peptococcaceae bacterium]|nr:RHS repeat-associated core domain-containing protein [Peptococcaceae bacterium]
YYYDAFGNILESTGDVNNNITYAGYQYDEETGLYYLNARMYEPKIARFLQEDTYRGDPMDPLSLNLYAYCAYNPIMYYDPTGHFSIFSGDDWRKLARNIKEVTIGITD